MTGYPKRTRLFIAKRFQIRYISLILLFMFTTAIVTGYMVYVTTWIMFGEKLAAVYPQGLLMDIVKKVNMVLFLRLIFLTPLVILIAMVLSHRIAGPIYRTKRHISGMARGDYDTRLQLREKDELKDLADAVNHLAVCLRSGRDKCDKAALRAISKVEALEAAIIAGDTGREKLLKDVLEIRQYIDDIRRG